MPITDHFITPGYLARLEKEEAKFLLEHAEKQLKDILDTNNLIVGRTTTLLTVTDGIVIALMGYTITQCAKNPLNAITLTSAVVDV